jgi:tungstate transport system substrate-binding protein
MLLSVTLVAVLTVTMAFSACVSNSGKPAAQKMILATTTSTQDSGLLDFLIPKFDSKYNVKTSVVSVGSGAALALGQSGVADVLLVHSKAAELTFVANGYGMYRKDVMYNWFMIIGPTADPAGIKSMNDTIKAFKAIYDTNSTFCSRGDNSGTYTKEVGYWKKVNVTDYNTKSWYLNLSQGMGETLTTSNEKKAYTLADSGTWYSMKQNLPNLQIVLEGDKANLLNQYGVIPVNGSNGPHVNTKLGLKFADWIVSPETQAIIATYQKGGMQLFFPNAAG